MHVFTPLSGRTARAALLALLMGAVAGCGGGGSGEPPPPAAGTPLPASVSVVGAADLQGGTAGSWSLSPAPAADHRVSWTFGDGQAASGANVAHTYERPGRYALRATVADTNGRSVTAQTTVLVARCGPVDAGRWCQVWPDGEQTQVRSVAFADARTAWAAGAWGGVWLSTDGGATWRALDLPDARSVRQVLPVSAAVAWVVTTDGMVQRTLDGGQRWTRVPSLPDGIAGLERARNGRMLALVDTVEDGLARPRFVSDDDGLTWRALPAATYDLPILLEPQGTLWRCCWAASVDGGRSFGEPLGVAQQPLFGADDHAWAYAPDGGLMLRAGVVAAWQAVRLPDLPYWHSNAYGFHADATGTWLLVNENAWGAGLSGRRHLYHRANANAGWREVPLPPPFDGTGTFVDFLDGRTAVVQQQRAAGPNRGLLTVDAGTNWTVLNTGVSSATQVAAPLENVRREPGGALLASHASRLRHAYSLDNGQTWRAIPSAPPPDTAVTALAMASPAKGLMLMEGAERALRTDDGGVRWAPAGAALPAGALSSLHFTAEDAGWLVADGTLYRSRDAGLSWGAPLAATSALGRVLTAQFLDARTGYAVIHSTTACTIEPLFLPGSPVPGRIAALQRTDDAGGSWRAVGDAWCMTEGAPVLMRFRTAAHGVLDRGDGSLRVTKDAGASWTPVAAPVWSRATAVAFQGEEIWVVAGSFVYRSLAGGQHWQAVTPPEGLIGGRHGPTGAAIWRLQAKDLRFVDAANGWLVGERGLLLRTQDGGASWQTLDAGTRGDLLWLRHEGGRLWTGGAGSTLLRWTPGT